MALREVLCKNLARKLQETCKKNYTDVIDVFRDSKENVGELCKKKLSPVWKIETILDACVIGGELDAIFHRCLTEQSGNDGSVFFRKTKPFSEIRVAHLFVEVDESIAAIGIDRAQGFLLGEGGKAIPMGENDARMEFVGFYLGRWLV